MALPQSLLVALLLSVPSFAHTPYTHFDRRALAIPTKLPGNWTSQGCYTDNAGGVRTLNGAQYAGDDVTPEKCINFCSTSSPSYIYAGVEYGRECYCGNSLLGTNSNASLADCSMACAGNATEACGNGNRLNLFWSGAQPPAPPTTNPGVGDWKSLGCYNDTAAARALPIGVGTNGQVTVTSCTTACFNAGYPYAGMEYAAECYCGAAISNFATSKPLGDCSMTCQGNSSEYCGGPDRLNVYNYTGTNLPTTPTNPPPGGGGGNENPNVTPVYSGLPGTWNYSGCYVDNANGRIFSTQLTDDPTLTVDKCVANCNAQNFTVAGVEYGVQCFCGKTLINGATLGSGCNMECPGNSTQACGAGNRLSVYSSSKNITIIPVPTIVKEGLPGKWKYAGCIREPGAARVLPYENDWPGNNTVQSCVAQCSKFGYPAAGLEYSRECWCGDVANLEGNGGVWGEDSECGMPCDGDPYHICGGQQRLSVYTTEDKLFDWHTPAVTGHYEFLIGGLVVPLIATVGINNKVTFLEKSGTSAFPNSTGAYELDLSLVHDHTKAWREMHVKSDVFCAASLILPDRKGRQINIGGWSLDSTKGLRLFTPDGSPGVNGTNDWEEDFEQIHLQRQRWYPSAVLLTNGSILVVGGELGSNDKPEPSIEILPQPAGGPTYLNMTWLQRTDPWNLYPFLFILPSEHVFVGYYNEARILDEKTFATIKEFPNAPAAVNNFNGGRTYPMEGASVMLPQHAPYTDPVEILMCGGSTIPAMIALDNCVRIAPEVTGAEWIIERMPSKRVLPCMAALPDGTYLIANGAHQGHAGFGLANDPNLQALLYDPTLPSGSRISILNTTIVARLYHSEATLLPDGRVLISGSDPNPTGEQVYPEEFRVEVYIPPYLATGLKQPEYTITARDWTYGGKYTISNIKLYQGTTSTLRVSMIAATSSTHGAIMGGRTIFPAFSCTGTSCTITAPPTVGICPPGWFMLFILDGPTPSHAQWIRIGGDPGQLGNWPNLPGFHPPGMGGI